jgi:hypothetical protein
VTDADPQQGDDLPEELDVTAWVGPVEFPNITRRRIAGWLYVVIALACLGGWLESSNKGLLAAAVFIGLIAVYHFVTAWDVRIDQTEALVVASRTVGFPVGHASAQLGWSGLRSRPNWRILLYSADSPPSMRGLVQIDAVDAAVMGEYTEHNPEDWSEFDDAAATTTPTP